MKYYVYTGFSCEYFDNYQSALDFANNFISPYSEEQIQLDVQEV